MDIKLRALNSEDIPQLARLANNFKVWENLRDLFPHPYSESDAAFFIDLCSKHDPQQNFAIEYQGELCGVIGLTPQQDVYRKTSEIGYWLGEPFWGKGIATKAVELMTRRGFEELGFVRIHTGIFEHNIGSMRVLEKNGYKKEAIFKKNIFKNGKTCDEHRYFKLNPNFDS